MITLWGRNNSTNVKKVLLTLEELELPYEQILAGREFGINHDADFLAMNPNGLVPLLRDDESDLILWESTPLSAIWRHSTGKTPVDRLTGTSCGSGKMDGLGKPDTQ
ncbi:glutathione S-transferase [Escherichia coli]|uniref:Glutathione S-transferase n=1 Tax=Escherichia coli TaxID=562 RepID=A0A376UCU9_ECOLX|nr:glutathione S-transferase [Escherichia coli]